MAAKTARTLSRQLGATYDPEANCGYVRIRRSKAVISQVIANSVVVDFDKAGEVVGVEVLGPTPYGKPSPLAKAAGRALANAAKRKAKD